MSQILGVVMLVYLGWPSSLSWPSCGLSPRSQQGGRGLLWARPGLADRGPHRTLGIPPTRWPQATPRRRLFLDKLSLIIMQAPLSNRYESLVFFSWCLPAVGLIAFRKNLQGWLGAVVAMLACLLLAYASFGGADAHIKPLMPALKSNWLLIHVVTAFLGYAAFAVAFGAALLYLVQEKRPRPTLPALPLLDRLLYRATMLGFLLLTFGILTGRGLGRNRLGPLLELGPQGDLVPDHLAHLRRPAPRPPAEGLAGPAHRLAGGPGVPGGDLHLSRGQLPLPACTLTRPDPRPRSDQGRSNLDH